MEFIIDFYKSLDTLNLIIFWGIIIVIILLLIFAFILMNKNKKLKSLVEKNNKKEEEIPIKIEELPKEKDETIEFVENLETEETMEDSIILPEIPEISKEKRQEVEKISKPIETEKRFVAEEHVMEYNKDLFSLSNIKKNNEQPEEKNKYDIKNKSAIEMPTGPYQRNVLREMSLGQTSPIGITTRVNKEEKKIEMAKDLEESLNKEQNEIFTTKNPSMKNKKEEFEKEYKKEPIQNETKEVNNQIKKELSSIENPSPRKTEIKIESISINTTNNEGIPKEKEVKQEEIKPTIEKTTNMTSGQLSAKELLDRQPIITEEKTRKTSSEKYLEEVSRKLAEAEIPDEIERTDYELEQEENAIISYKELMEKKDSIQTIDEEEAIISIEELMNRNNQKTEEIKDETKLYKLTEEEENDDFINELKQFRNDL